MCKKINNLSDLPLIYLPCIFLDSVWLIKEQNTGIALINHNDLISRQNLVRRSVSLGSIFLFDVIQRGTRSLRPPD